MTLAGVCRQTLPGSGDEEMGRQFIVLWVTGKIDKSAQAVVSFLLRNIEPSICREWENRWERGLRGPDGGVGGRGGGECIMYYVPQSAYRECRRKYCARMEGRGRG